MEINQTYIMNRDKRKEMMYGSEWGSILHEVWHIIVPILHAGHHQSRVAVGFGSSTLNIHIY